jgi:hypothetical protein
MIGLLNEEEAAVRKNGKSEQRKGAAGQGQLRLQLPGLVREALYETVIAAGLACVDEVLEAQNEVDYVDHAINTCLGARRCAPAISPAH